mgnify:CR=1 FL=1
MRQSHQYALVRGVSNKVIPYLQFIVDSSGKRVGVEVLLRAGSGKQRSISEVLNLMSIDERANVKIAIIDKLAGGYLKKLGVDSGFINLNVSNALLGNKTFIKSLVEFSKNNFHYKLNVELLENEHHPDSGVIFSNLLELSKNSIGLYMDDFGSGSFSFDLFREGVFDGVKISRELLNESLVDSSGKLFYASAVDYFRSKGVKVVGEGIENTEQIDFAKNVHCDYLQGFYFSKPERITGQYDVVV